MKMPEFEEFFEILANGERDAVDRLMKWLDPWLRSVIRVRLARGRLRGVVDVSDIYQSLIKDFVRRANGDLSQRSDDVDMVRYLAVAAENKIRARWRKDRKHARYSSGGGELEDRRPSVEQMVESDDFVRSIRDGLNDETQDLLDLRLQGFTWPEVATASGGNPDALRMRVRRSVAARICELRELELPDER
jgi:hypothetical protein